MKTKKINRPTRGKTKCRDCGTNLAFGIIGGGTTGSENKRGVGHGVEHFQQQQDFLEKQESDVYMA